MTIPANAIYQTDCLALFERLEAEQVQLIYIDSPLHVDAKKAMVADADDQASREYLRFLSIVLQHSQRVLSESGTLFFHTEPDVTSRIRPVLNKIFKEENHRADFIWPRHSKVRHDRKVAGPSITHDTILFYSKTSEYTYNQLFSETVKQQELYHLTDVHGRSHCLTKNLTR